MTTVETIIAAIAELPPEQVAQIRAWLNERAEAEWDASGSPNLRFVEPDVRVGRNPRHEDFSSLIQPVEEPTIAAKH